MSYIVLARKYRPVNFGWMYDSAIRNAFEAAVAEHAGDVVAATRDLVDGTDEEIAEVAAKVRAAWFTQKG